MHFVVTFDVLCYAVLHITARTQNGTVTKYILKWWSRNVSSNGTVTK
jgi:hypothetical protein